MLQISLSTILKNLLFLIFTLSSLSVQAQNFSDGNVKNKNPFPTKYVNKTDESLVIKSISIAKVFDNVDGVYSKGVEQLLKELVSKDHAWALTEYKFSKKNYRIDEFETEPADVLQALSESNADALLTCFILKGPTGLNIQLNLFNKDKGYLLVREEFQDQNIFEINKINDAVIELYKQLKSKMPYVGYVTSRNGNSTTVNMGSRLGLKSGDVLTVAQIVKINRHPKLNFMVGVEKEIIGRIALTKVDEETSFGEITFEKETGVITKGSKILPLNFVKYTTTQASPVADSFPNEKNPYEWLPSPTPQFGKVHIIAGLSDFTQSLVLQDGSNLDSGNRAAPYLDMQAELWITPEVYANIDLRQMYFKGTNALSGSTPSTLNYTVGRVEFSMGYKYLIDGNFWGPNIYSSLGYLSHNVRVTDSTPTGFTSYELTGLSITAGGMFPVTLKKDWAFGGQAKFMLFEHFNETPVDSGKANSDFTEFTLMGTYQYTTNINLKGQIIFQNIQTTFNLNGNKNPISRSVDEKATSYMFGFEYLF
ncbi:MAG: hypothetical protein ACK4VO_00215 [Pseudobdellovibrio sp.]